LHYAKNIRKEYHIYPDLMYNPGRIKVLQHFLQKSNIYFTQAFQAKEAAARQNLQQEIQLLQS